MADERLKHQCHRDGCDSPAVWRARLSLHAAGPGVERIDFDGMPSVQVCDAHRKAAIDYVLSDANKDEITRAFAETGLARPDWSSATVGFVPIANPEPDAPEKPVDVVTPCDRDGCVLPAKF